MANDNSWMKILADNILTAIDQKLQNARFDRTTTGTVLKQLSGGRYLVKIDGEDLELSLPSAIDGILPMSKVRVTTPSGKRTERFISSKIK